MDPSLVAASQGYSLGVVHGLLIVVASLVVEHRLQAHRLQQLWHVNLVVRRHVESSRTRDQTYIPFIARWILYHLTTREVPSHLLNKWD